MIDKKVLIPKILKTLHQMYPDAHCELIYKTSWQLLVAIILSAQSTDKTVNSVTPALFKKYPTPQLMAKADILEVQQMIYQTGFFRNKTNSIIKMSQEVIKKFKGEVPKKMEELITLPGVGRKTANVVLGEAYGLSEGIVVDTHVIRLTTKIWGVVEEEWSKNSKFEARNPKQEEEKSKYQNSKSEIQNRDNENAKMNKTKLTPEKIESELMKIIPEKEWMFFSFAVVLHGRYICVARKPKCRECKMKGFCPSSLI